MNEGIDNWICIYMYIGIFIVIENFAYYTLYLYILYLQYRYFYSFKIFWWSFYTLTNPIFVTWSSFVCVILKFPLMNEIYHSLSNLISRRFYPVLYKNRDCQRFQLWWKMTWNCIGGTFFLLNFFFILKFKTRTSNRQRTKKYIANV